MQVPARPGSMKPLQAKPYVRLIACLTFLDVTDGGLRKIAELHVLLEEAYPKHVRYFLQKHGSEIPGLTEDLLLYKSRNQPWPGSSIMEFYQSTKDLINNRYNPEFLANCNPDGSLPSGRSLEELRMATKEQLWNKHQLELVAKNMQSSPSEPPPQTPDPQEAQESLAESPELLAEQKKNGSGRRKQTSVIPFDVTNPIHRDWTPLGWIAWLHLGLGSPEPHDKFSLKPSGGDVPPAQNQMTPDFHQRMSRGRSEQRRKLRENNRPAQEDLGRGFTDPRASDSLSNVFMAAVDRLMCHYRQSHERTQMVKERNQMIHERTQKINNLQMLMQITAPGSSDHAQAKAELVQLLKGTADNDNIPIVAEWECASGTPGSSSIPPASVTNSRNMGIASPVSSVVATPVSLSDERIFTNDVIGTTENCSPQSRVRARPMDLDRLFKKNRTNNV